MAAGLLRVVVLLLAVAAGTRAQQGLGVWHNHGRPTAPVTTYIRTAMVPLTHFYGKKWFGAGDNGKLYERYEDSSGNWQWADHGKPSTISYRWYIAEPCAFEGLDRVHATTNDGYLYQRRWTGAIWATTYLGRPFPTYVSGRSSCSTTYRPGLRARTFMRASDGTLRERYWWSNPGNGAGLWVWRNHGTPPSTSLRTFTKISSYLGSTGWSSVYAVGLDGNAWQRWTHPTITAWAFWLNRGKPTGKWVRRVHATLAGGLWVITTDGDICQRRGVLWQCFGFPLTNRRIQDCSDPFGVSGGRISIFCITNTGISTLGSSGYGLYQLSLENAPLNESPEFTWTYHGVPTMPHFYYFIDRPNVAFDTGNNVESVFVTSNRGVFELRF